MGGRQYLGGPLSAQLSAQPAHRLDAGRKLFAGGRGYRWAAAETAQFVVNPTVRLANSIMRRCYQRIEFATEVTQLSVPGDRLGYGGAAVELLFLVAAQQVAHLPGIQKPWDA